MTLGTLCLAPSLVTAQDAPPTPFDLESARLVHEVANSLGVSTVAVATLASLRVSDDLIAIDVPLPDGPARILLRPHSVRTPEYRLVVQEADGSYREHDSGVERTYRGYVEGIDGSIVAASLEGEAIRALVLIPGRDRIWVEPALGVVAADTNGLHAIYEDSAVPVGGRCGLAEHALGAGDRALAGSVTSPLQSIEIPTGLPNETWFAELAVDSDVEFFERFETVEATEARIHAIINTVNVQYERDVGIQHVLSHLIVRTAPVAMYASRSANSLLFEFSDFWFRFQGSIQRDTAHLFTGKSLSEGILGLANFSGICDTREGYGLSGYNKRCNAGENAGDTCGADAECPGGSCVDAVCQAFACRTDLTAHELGHNWAAPHCPLPAGCLGWTMNATVQGANRFHPEFTIPRILAYLETVSFCLFQGDELIDLFVDPATPQLGGGSELALSATADFLHGIDKDVTALAIWSTDRPEVATIDAGGLLLAAAVDIEELITVTASFTFDGTTMEASSLVTILPAPPAPIADPDNVEKNRYISLIPPPVSGEMALQVTLVSLQRPVPPNLAAFPPFNFSVSEGDTLWVGPPVVCADVPVPNRDYLCATLSCEPYFTDSWGDEVVHVTGAEIMPSSAYDVRVIPVSCRDEEDSCAFASPPLPIATQRWGDVAPPYQVRSPDLVSAIQPNIFDVIVVVDRAKKLPNSFLKPLVHLWSKDNGLELHGEVSVLDIISTVDAVKGRAYPFFGPCECPPRAPCPSTDRCGRCVQE